MFNSGMNSSVLGIIGYYILPTPGSSIPKFHLIFEANLVQAIGIAIYLSFFCTSPLRFSRICASAPPEIT